MQTVEKLTDRNALHEPSSLVDALAATLDDLERYMIAARDQQRWPRIRFGERERISPTVRKLVFERDGGCCLGCGTPLTIRTAQLDHIVPWSAGGPDCSHNLRVLCQPCNEDRSNFRTGLDDHAARRLHVAVRCLSCVHLYFGDEEPYASMEGDILAYCGHCGNVSLTCPELVL